MSDYSDAAAVQMRRAEDQYLREPDEVTAEGGHTADLQFLAWSVECEVWRLMAVTDFAKSVEDVHYSGCGEVTSIMALDPAGGPCRKGAVMVAGKTETDGDDYMHTRWEIRGDSGEVFGAFTTRIDGRS